LDDKNLPTNFDNLSSFKLAQISLFLNHKNVFKHIEKNYKDGIFLILESDAEPIQWSFVKDLTTIIDFLHIYKDWDNLSLSRSYHELIYRKRILPEIQINNEFKMSATKNSNCTDSILWNYSGIQKILKYIDNDNDFSLPIDTWLNDIYAKYDEFKAFIINKPIICQRTVEQREETTLK
jgi:hypothetical protein